MAYRKFDTGTWQDPWFEDLDTKAKLAFIYLWTNDVCNQAGFYEISEKRIRFQLGFSIDDVADQLKDKIAWFPDKKLIWVKSFFRHQCQNFKFALAALASIKDDSFRLKLFIEQNRKLMVSFRTKDGDQIIDLSAYETDTVSSNVDTVSPENDMVSSETDTIQPGSDIVSPGSDTISPENHTISYRTEQNSTDTEAVTEQNSTEIKTPSTTPQRKSGSKSKTSQPPSSPSGSFSKKKITPFPVTPKSRDGYHGIKKCGPLFQGINKACDQIAILPPKKKKFSPQKWAQSSINSGAHPGAVMETLQGLSVFWDGADDPWGVCNKILKTKNGSWNEKDAIAIHEDFKTIKPTELEFLTNGLFQGVS